MAQWHTTNTRMQRPAQNILTLQLLRGMAASLVVFAHSIDFQEVYVPGHSAISSLYSIENFGAVGVDLFFVISGFIMASIAPDAGEERAAIRFAIKRIIRIVPIYWLLSGVAALVAVQSGAGISLAGMISSITFIPVYPHGHFQPPIILVGWSLSFEMFFYLAIAASLAIRKRGAVVPGVAWICFGLSVAGIFIRPRGTFAAFLLSPLLAEFAIGCLIGQFYRKRQSDLPSILSMSLLAGGVVCLLATVWRGFGSISEMDSILMGDGGGRRLLLWGIPSGLIVAGLVGSERRWRERIPPALCLIGDASYSIYLLQLLALRQFAMRWNIAGFGHPDLFIAAALLFAVLAGIAHYGIIERPLTLWLQRRCGGVLGRKLPREESSTRSTVISTGASVVTSTF